MTESAAVLFANDAFYTAFANGDFDAMCETWADDDNLTCIHPGWAPLSGRDIVLDSWRAILSAPESPKIRCLEPQAHIMGETAYVIGYEQLSAGALAMTNIFVRKGRLWRMIHHQAGPCQDAPQEQPVNETDHFQ